MARPKAPSRGLLVCPAPSLLWCGVLVIMECNMSKTILITTIVFVLVLAAGAAFLIWGDLKVNSPNLEVELPSPSGSSTSSPRVEEPKITWPLPVPNLDRPVKITENLPPETQLDAREAIALIIVRLKENPELSSHWIDLGLYRKLIGDFEGAREAWEYAARLRPKEGLAFHNLGDLYGLHLKNPQKAEENYLKAIALQPDQTFFYEKLYEFYRFTKKDETKAREILEKGIARNPDSSLRLRWLLDNFSNTL
ncbi:MAG: tetratricopeptide repeat protein [bacterium]|nr:tetratricopeptide repeat protein [bacterium]